MGQTTGPAALASGFTAGTGAGGLSASVVPAMVASAATPKTVATR